MLVAFINLNEKDQNRWQTAFSYFTFIMNGKKYTGEKKKYCNVPIGKKQEKTFQLIRRYAIIKSYRQVWNKLKITLT